MDHQLQSSSKTLHQMFRLFTTGRNSCTQRPKSPLIDRLINEHPHDD